jgi:hypothetical protein
MSTTDPALGGQRTIRDLAFILVLLGLAAVPLLVLRNQPIFFSQGFQLSIWLVGACILAAWTGLDRRSSPVVSGSEPKQAYLWAIGLGLGLVFIEAVVFYLPMMVHFWGGCDEFCCLYPNVQTIWCIDLDRGHSRALWGLAALLGSLLTPDRVDGFLWASAGLCVLNGLLLAGIVRRALPGEPAIAAAAGVLLICHRGDQSRFFVMWTGMWYWTSLATLLLAAWLFLESGHSGHRGSLIAACIALGASLLGTEAGYPLAALAPALLYFSGVKSNRLLVWSCAWYGTIGLCAIRFLDHLLSSNTYQAQQSQGLLSDPRKLLLNLTTQSEAFLTWFRGFAALKAYWPAMLAASVGAAVVVLLAGKPISASRRGYLLGVVVATLFAIAGLAPFIPFDVPFRTQFYTAPGQAALIAIALGAATSVLGRHCGTTALAVCVAVLAGAAAGDNRRFQNQADKYVNFPKTVHVLRQIHGLTPDANPDTVIILIPEEGTDPTLGVGYSVIKLSQNVLGHVVIQGKFTPDNLVEVFYEPERVDIVGAHVLFPGRRLECPYEKLILFRTRADGTVSLLERIPEELNPAPTAAERYKPLALLKPGTPRELRYMRYMAWMKPPLDVVEVEGGIVLGEGWSDMEEDQDRRLYRRAEAGAALVINPMGQETRSLQLEVELLPPSADHSLEIRGDDGKVLARAPIRGRESINFELPTVPTRVSMISLRVTPDDAAAGKVPSELRVYAPPGTRPPDSSTIKRDIVRGGIVLGKGWHGLESFQGKCFRWFTREAEIQLRNAAGRELVLDANGGPGLGHRQGQVRLVGPGDRVLAEAQVNDLEHTEIRCVLPSDLPAVASIRLQMIGGGQPIPGDSRILDGRVFRCELRR